MSAATETIAKASKVVEMLVQAKDEETKELPYAPLPAYSWAVKRRAGGKPSQAWVLMSPELSPERQRIQLCCTAQLTLEQAEQIGQAMIRLAGELDPKLSDPYVYKKQAGARYWEISWPDGVEIKLKSGGYPIILESKSRNLPPKTAWQIGSHLLQLVRQRGNCKP